MAEKVISHAQPSMFALQINALSASAMIRAYASAMRYKFHIKIMIAASRVLKKETPMKSETLAHMCMCLCVCGWGAGIKSCLLRCWPYN